MKISLNCSPVFTYPIEIKLSCHEMTVYLNMLSSFMEYHIRSNMKDNMIVIPKFC